MTTKEAKKRLEYLRGEIKKECISYGEIAELQSLAKYINPGDVELLEWAGVPENKHYIKQSGYRYCRYLGKGEHVLQIKKTGEIEIWFSNKNHASYGLIYKNTHLEFARSTTLGELPRI